jgi:hypothetical protein
MRHGLRYSEERKHSMDPLLEEITSIMEADSEDPEEVEEEEEVEEVEDPEEEEASAEASDAGDGTPDGEVEVDSSAAPETYMGLDLSALDPKERAAVVERFKAKDKYAQGLETRLKEGDTPPAAEDEEPTDLEELSDEDLLKQYGFDPEDPVAAEIQLPLIRQMDKQNAALELMMSFLIEQQQSGQFNSVLDQVEETDGKLEDSSITRDDILSFMQEKQIGDPQIAYDAIKAERQRLLSGIIGDVKNERDPKATEAAKRRIADGKKTRTRKAGPAPKKGEMLDAREASRQAIEELVKKGALPASWAGVQ